MKPSDDRGMSQTMDKIRRIAFDAAILIYFLERHQVWYPVVAPYVEQCTQDDVDGLGSVLLLTEILTGVRKRRATHAERQVHAFFAEPKGVRLVDTSLAIADRAATLRATYGLRTPDAIHVATALESGAKSFITADRNLGTIRGIKIEVLGMKRPR